MREFAWADDDTWALTRYYLAPIETLLTDEAITDVLVNRYDDIFVDHLTDGLVKSDRRFDDETAVVLLIEQIAKRLD